MRGPRAFAEAPRSPAWARPRVPWLLGVAALALSAIVAVAAVRPPAVRAARAPADEFSAERALVHLRAIAREPRPPGTEAHAKARDYIVETLEAMGLEVELQRTRAAVRMAGNVMGADVENVVARLRSGAQAPGDDRGAVLLAAHYDSVPHSLGASDDGSAVAALLETARALQAGPPLPRDVIVLVTDAEELGLLGAIGFVEGHRWRDDVAVALNFEARGCRGATAMYATSPGNAPLVDALARAAPRPVSSSLVGLLAQALPNDSDATIFIRAGYPTYAFAYAEGVEHYHQHTDDLARHDPRSMQHQGDYALTMTKELAARPPGSLRSDEAWVYFDLFARWLVRYPRWLGRALAVAEALLLAWLLVAGTARGSLRWRSVALGAAVAIGTLLVLPLGTWLAGVGLSRFVEAPDLVARAHRVAWLVVSLSGGLWLACWLLPLRVGHAASVAMGGLLPVAAVGVGLGLLAPEAAYPWTWALLGALPAAMLWLSRLEAGGSAVDLGVTLPLLPAVVLWSTTAFTVHVLQGVFTPTVLAVVIALPAPLLLPAVARLGSSERKGACAALLVAAVGASAVAGWPGAPRPQADSLVYGIDLDSGLAQWMSHDRRPDSFVQQRVPAHASIEPLTAFSPWIESARVAPAARVPLVGATASRSASTSGDGSPPVAPGAVLDSPGGACADVDSPRDVSAAVGSGTLAPRLPRVEDPSGVSRKRLRIDAPAEARCLLLWDEDDDRVLGARFDGSAVVELARFSPERDEELYAQTSGVRARARWRARYCGLGGRPLVVDLAVRGDAPANIRVVTITDGIPGPPLTPRPWDRYPAMSSDVTLVSRRFAASATP